MMMDEMTGQTRGFGFVCCDAPESVDVVMSMPEGPSPFEALHRSAAMRL